MIAVFTVLLMLAVSMIVIRVASVGLVLTGVSKDLAYFQALSAFTGSGFTTKESEDIVNHPVRRRIVMHLMLLGNVGLVVAISSVVAFLLQPNEKDGWYDATWVRMVFLLLGVILLALIAASRHLEQLMWRLNTWALKRWSTLDVMDYTGLLRLAHNYVVSELSVQDDDWLAGRTLAELQLPSEGVLVLGIERRDGHYVGAPRGQTNVETGDSLILYGRQETLVDLDNRRADLVGNLHHVMAVTRQLDVLDEQEPEEPDSEIQSVE